MEEIKIYKYQLDVILDALRMTANLHDSRKGVTAYDRVVRQAESFAKNALEGNINNRVQYH